MLVRDLSWILVSAFSAIPYVLSGEIPRYVDAFFEMVSGFTTTGSSILTNIEGMSHTGLFWRSFTHWIGGMGILVFILIFILSSALSFGKNLARTLKICYDDNMSKR